MNSSVRRGSGNGLAIILLVAVAIILGVVVYYTVFWKPPIAELPQPVKPLAEPTVELETAEVALASRDGQQAEKVALEFLDQNPGDVRALIVAARAASLQQSTERSLSYYDQVPLGSTQDYANAQTEAATMLMYQGRLLDAERRFKLALAQVPSHFVANDKLARLLNHSGRPWESLPYLNALLQSKSFSLEHLIMVGNIHKGVDDRQILELARQAFPNDVLPNLGTAMVLASRDQWQEVLPVIEPIAAAYPQIPDVQATLGLALVETEQLDRLPQWNQELPKQVEDHPGIWLARGRWAEKTGQPEAAMRCFWEGLMRHAGDARLSYRLGTLLRQAGRDQEAKPYFDHAEQLERLNESLNLIFETGPQLRYLADAAQATDALGRPWESWGWYRFLMELFPNQTALRKEFRRLTAAVELQPPMVLAANNPARQVRLSQLSLPKWDALPTGDTPVVAQQESNIRFRDAAADLGIDFQYYNGDNLAEPGMMIYETYGGGVGVLDYDGDGWPDLYLTQGNDFPPADAGSRFDRLFHNRLGEKFNDVTELARLRIGDYAQGVAIGDYNQDGFPDVYVANVGQNRLLRNEGDGTFTDVTAEVGLTDQVWTTSAAVADLNGDGLPDLYDANYIAAGPAFERTYDESGKLIVLKPSKYAAEPDRCWLNQGDGTFLEASKELGITGENGRAMGVLVHDFDGNGLLDVFVANDMTSNFLYLNLPDETDKSIPPFQESGLIAGVALDRNGRSQACMGIALGDADRDGLPELFVTNFLFEPNTLYKQIASDAFFDETAKFRLNEPSHLMLGFGTQFIDLDLDGWPDLVVTNGHIDQFPNSPFEMRPQVFRNLGNQQFAELPPEKMGPYFEEKFLGRALARVDWDRDGREDVAIGHLRQPFALLRNETEGAGNFLSLQLKGKLHRDAVGTRIRYHLGDEVITQFVTAGDGFQASNSRDVITGLGKADQVDRIEIDWVGGKQQVLEKVPANQSLLVVEGEPPFVRLSE